MRHVRLRMAARGHEEAIHEMFAVLTTAPCVERATAMQWNFSSDTTVSFLHYIDGDMDGFEARVSGLDSVLDYDLEPAGERAFYAYIQSTTTAALRSLTDQTTSAGVVVVPPIVYHEDGSLTLSVFGPSDEIQAGLETVPSLIDITVEEIGGLAAMPSTVGTRLSSRQREAIEAAFELGYYEIPRRAGHEAIADAIDCAPSTAAEHLRKAESRLLRSVLGDRLQ